MVAYKKEQEQKNPKVFTVPFDSMHYHVGKNLL